MNTENSRNDLPRDPETGSFAPAINEEELVNFVRRSDVGVTTNDVTEHFDLPTTTARDHLNRLTETGHVSKAKKDSNTALYYVESADTELHEMDDQLLHKEMIEYLKTGSLDVPEGTMLSSIADVLCDHCWTIPIFGHPSWGELELLAARFGFSDPLDHSPNDYLGAAMDLQVELGTGIDVIHSNPYNPNHTVHRFDRGYAPISDAVKEVREDLGWSHGKLASQIVERVPGEMSTSEWGTLLKEYEDSGEGFPRKHEVVDVLYDSLKDAHAAEHTYDVQPTWLHAYNEESAQRATERSLTTVDNDGGEDTIENQPDSQQSKETTNKDTLDAIASTVGTVTTPQIKTNDKRDDSDLVTPDSTDPQNQIDGREFNTVTPQQIHEYIEDEPCGVKVSELAAKFDSPKSTIRDRLEQLTEQEAIQREKKGHSTVLYYTEDTDQRVTRVPILDDRAREYLQDGIILQTEAIELAWIWEELIHEAAFELKLNEVPTKEDLELLADRGDIDNIESLTWSELHEVYWNLTDEHASPFDYLYPRYQKDAIPSLPVNAEAFKEIRHTLGLTQAEVGEKISNSDDVEVTKATIQTSISRLEQSGYCSETRLESLISFYRDQAPPHNTPE